MADRDILKQSFTATPQCLSLEQLESLAAGQKTHPHLAACPRCQAELALLKAFESDTPLADEGAAVGWISARLERRRETIKHPWRTQAAAVPRQSSWWARSFGLGKWRWALPATAVLVAVIAGVIAWRSPKQPDLQANLRGQSAIYRSQEVLLMAPLGELQGVPKTLLWQAFPGAGMYRVTVMEVDRSPLWSGETKETSMEIPVSLRAKMLPGKPILWQVTALDQQGRILASSQLQRFVSPRQNSSGKLSQ
jgi:hypothetical protein